MIVVTGGSGKLGRVAGAVGRQAEHARRRDAGRDASHIRPDPGVAGGTGGEAIGFTIGQVAVGHAQDRIL